MQKSVDEPVTTDSELQQQHLHAVAVVVVGISTPRHTGAVAAGPR